MCEILTKKLIHAAPEKVWRVLTDFKAYGSWNHFIKNIEGVLAMDGQLTVTIQPPGKKPMIFKPQIKKLKTNSELRWRGQFFAKWLFSGEHYFILNPGEQGNTELIHGEKFSGLLVPLFSFFGGLKSTEQGFHLMNEQLAVICKE